MDNIDDMLMNYYADPYGSQHKSHDTEVQETIEYKFNIISMKKETEKGCLIDLNEYPCFGEHWFPKSYIKISIDDKILTIPEWLYYSKVEQMRENGN